MPVTPVASSSYLIPQSVHNGFSSYELTAPPLNSPYNSGAISSSLIDIQNHPAQMRDLLGHFGHPVILYDGHPYSLPEEMQYRPSSTSFDDLWRFGKMGREGEMEAQQEDLMDIIDRLAQGMEEEREIEKLRCELNEKVHPISPRTVSPTSVCNSPLLTHSSTTRYITRTSSPAFAEPQGQPASTPKSLHSPQHCLSTPCPSVSPKTPYAPLMELAADTVGAHYNGTSLRITGTDASCCTTGDVPLLATLPSLALLYPSSSFNNEDVWGKTKMAYPRGSTVEPASIRRSLAVVAKKEILDAAFSSRHVSRFMPIQNRSRAGSDPISAKPTSSELYRRSRETSLPVRAKHPFLPRNLADEPSPRARTLAFSFEDARAPGAVKRDNGESSTGAEDERDPLDLLADVAGTRVHSADSNVSVHEELFRACPSTPIALDSKQPLLAGSSMATIFSSPSSRDTWDDTEDEAYRYRNRGKGKSVTCPRSKLALMKMTARGGKQKPGPAPVLTKDDKQGIQDMYLQRGGEEHGRTATLTSNLVALASRKRKLGDLLDVNDDKGRTSEGGSSLKSSKTPKVRIKGAMRAILDEDVGVPTLPGGNNVDDDNDILINPAFVTTGGLMSRSRMNEVYGLFKSTATVSGPRQSKPVHPSLNWNRPLVPAETKKRSRTKSVAKNVDKASLKGKSQRCSMTSTQVQSHGESPAPLKEVKVSNTGALRTEITASFAHKAGGTNSARRPMQRSATSVETSTASNPRPGSEREDSEDPIALKDSDEESPGTEEQDDTPREGMKANGGDNYTEEEDDILWRIWNGQRPLGPKALTEIRMRHIQAGYERTKEAIKWRINQLIKKRGAPLKAVKKIGRSDGAKTDSAREAGSRA